MHMNNAPDTALPPIGRIVISSVIGTAIEWYDFIAYGTASALVFSKLFFPSFDPAVALIVALGSYGVGFLARPFGAAFFGHLGDRVGRKTVLSITILLTGFGTFFIGCLPTYEKIGVLAPVALVTLRLLQGFGLGGERGGAVLMVIESVSDARRGLFGALVQLGYPLGVVLSAAAFALVTQLPEAAMLSWGWRVPFLASALLIGLGLFIRLNLMETAAFTEARAEHAIARAPMLEALANWRTVLRVAGLTVAEISFSFVATVYSISYATGVLGLSRSLLVNCVLAASIGQLAALPLIGWVSDRVGRKPVFLAGCGFALLFAFPFFELLDTREPILIALAIWLAVGIGHALMYSVEATWAAELFAARMRYSGSSLGLQLGAALTGGLTPMVVTALYAWRGATWPISVYLAALALVALISAFLSRETARKPLS